jgi:ATP:ADP antiporter, AAA family
MTPPTNSQENQNTLRGAAASFCVLASYYLLRPIRDEIGAEHRDLLAWLWTWVAILAMIIMPAYALLVSKVRKSHLTTRVYLTVSIILLAFAYAFHSFGEGSNVLSGAFYVMFSLYPLFIVSILWSSMTSLFGSASSKRQFGRIFAAGTAGSFLASSLVTFTASERSPISISPVGYLLLGTTLLMGAAWVLRPSATQVVPLDQPGTASNSPGNLGQAGSPDSQTESNRPGRWSTGLRHLLHSPYLRGIALNLLLFTVGSGFLYFMQSDLLKATYADRGDRRAVLGSMDLAVQSLTLLTQLFGTAGIIRKWGMAAILSIVPILSLTGFITLAIQPLFWVFAAFYILRRASNYALAKPAREILYTVVTPEERYLTKPILDVGLYRFGDLLTAWIYEGLAFATGFKIAGMALIATPFCLAWIPVARFLGRSQEEASELSESIKDQPRL